jgi:ribosomal 50S subunit-associated protein YjgA (DUF615 family)
MTSPQKLTNLSNVDMSSPNTRLNTLNNMNSHDQDEQFILEIIRSAKQESIQSLTDSLRNQESKSYLLIRLLERYKNELNDKDLMNK